jgi:hypothetical protein
VINVEARHVLVVEDGVPAAAAPLYVTRSCPKLEMFLRHYVERGPNAARPLAVVHSMYAQSSRVLAGDGLRGAVVDALEDTAFGDRPVDALAFPLLVAGDALLDELEERDYGTALLACTNLLEVEWDSFEAYLRSLRGSRRRNIAKALRRAREAGVSTRFESGSTDVVELAAILRRTAEHHRSPEFFSALFLRRALERFGERFHVIRVEADGAVRGACFCVADETQLVPWGVGLDYAALRRYDTYNLIYAAVVRLAIAQRVQLVNFGRSTYRIKAKYGCRLRPVHIAVRVHGPRTKIFRDWLAQIDEHARAELREFQEAGGDVARPLLARVG